MLILWGFYGSQFKERKCENCGNYGPFDCLASGRSCSFVCVVAGVLGEWILRGERK